MGMIKSENKMTCSVNGQVKKPLTIEDIEAMKRLMSEQRAEIKIMVNRYLPPGTILVSPDIAEMMNK